MTSESSVVAVAFSVYVVYVLELVKFAGLRGAPRRRGGATQR